MLQITAHTFYKTNLLLTFQPELTYVK